MAGVARTAADASSLALDANALTALRQQARDAPDKALSKAAGQFEALFVQMVLKQMRESLPKDGPLDSDSMRSYTAMFDQQLAQQLSGRGIGLKEAIERQLGKRVSADAAKPAAAMVIRPPVRETPLPSHEPVKARSDVVSSIAPNVQAFVDRIRPHAEAAAAALGVPARFLIAQAGLETGWGRSQPKDASGAVSHNLFGVKAGARWNGATVAAATTEFVQGAAVKTVEKFRAYGSYTSAFRDFAKLLSGSRYADALANAADPAAYAKSLQRAGYATDPAYADKLTRAIRMVSQHVAAAPFDGRRTAIATAGIQETPAGADISSDTANRTLG
jgi:peptidoglycan hydrolase FlgJ